MICINLLQGQLASERRRKASEKSKRYQRRHPERVKAYKHDYNKSVAARTSTYDWRKRNPEAFHNAHLRRKYGITIEQYRQMLARQGGTCAVCPRTEPGGKSKWFHVDHDHATGKVRGLLCLKHNTALGCVNDSVDELKKLVQYLEK